MILQQKILIKGLVKKYSEDIGTEGLIAFIADTNEMLAAGRALLKSLDVGESSCADWLVQDCLQHNVKPRIFLDEIRQIIALFDPGQDKEDHYAVLGIPSTADPDEIKRAYRMLSLRYHPDTSSSQNGTNPEKFIEIHKAYHALLSEDNTGKYDAKSTSKNNWRRTAKHNISSGQKTTVLIWALGILVVLAAVSIIATINIKNRAMLAGLQEGRGAFVPPAKTAVPELSHKAKISNKTEGQPDPDNIQKSVVASYEEKPLPEQQKEQTTPHPLPEYPSPELVKQSGSVQQSAAEKIIVPAVPQQRNQDKVIVTKSIANNQFAVQAEKQPLTSKIAPKENLVHDPPVTVVEIAGKVVDKPLDKHNNPVIVPITDRKTLPMVLAKVVEKEQHLPDLQSRVDIFFDTYIKAYEERNLSLFSGFFAADALENGKPFFTTMLPTYSDLFASTSALSLKVRDISWKENNGTIDVEGRFEVFIQYNDSRNLSGTGPIHFTLQDNNGDFQVSNLEYEFLAEQ